MKLSLIGLPRSGKATLFAALTGARGEEQSGGAMDKETRISTITLWDERLKLLSSQYKPKKTTYAKIQYLLPVSGITSPPTSRSEGALWSQVRVCDGLLHVVRNFRLPGEPSPDPEQSFWQLEEDMVLYDLAVAEKRMERIELDKKKGKRPGGEEEELLRSCCEILEEGTALRNVPHLALEPALKGFTFLSAKPEVVVINNEDEDESPPLWDRVPEGTEMMVVRARLEKEIASMPAEEAKEFQEAYHIEETVLDRVISASFRVLDQICFFTVSKEEVRSWSVPRGITALEAAGVVHSDIQRGFIRAEVLSYEDYLECGSFQEAKKAAKLRVEGKTYQVKDGDIIYFRFNV